MTQNMDKIQVATGNQPYNIYFQKSFDGLNTLLKHYCYNKDIKIGIIVDSNVDLLYTNELIRSLKEYTNMDTFVFDAGEKSKNIDTVTKAYDFLIQRKFDRKSILLALGGGVVGDLTGFIASTYMRGIDYIQIPTTLLSQVDSSVGGKTGFDYKGYKNMIGTFYQPKFVYMNLNTLKTLPPTEFNAGMAEAIKHGYIMDKAYLEYIRIHKASIKNLTYEHILALVQGSCRIKSQVVSQDEKELGLREILNFGHTIGHAVESLCQFNKLHGECVSIGMIAALYISSKVYALSTEEVKEAKALLQYFDLPTGITLEEHIDTEEVYKALWMDKKTKLGTLHFVLLDEVGKANRNTSLNKELIIESIQALQQQ